MSNRRETYNPIFQLSLGDKAQWLDLEVKQKDWPVQIALLHSQPRKKIEQKDLPEYQSLFDLFADEEHDEDGEEYCQAVREVIGDLLVGGNVAHLRGFLDHSYVGDDRIRAARDLVEGISWVELLFRPEMLVEIFYRTFDDDEYADWETQVRDQFVDCVSYEQTTVEQAEFLAHYLVYRHNVYAQKHQLQLRKEEELYKSLFGLHSNPDLKFVRSGDYASFCYVDKQVPVLLPYLYEKAGRPHVWPREIAQLVKVDMTSHEKNLAISTFGYVRVQEVMERYKEDLPEN